MLAISLRDLRQGRLVWEEEVGEPDRVWPDIGVSFIGRVRVRAEARTTGSGDVRVTGRLEAVVRLPCRRCLAELEQGLQIPLDLWFRREASDLDVGEGAVFLLDRQTRVVDLVPALREELLLSVPSYPLCAEECAGLCPQCGARRDEEGCDCGAEEPDPRWDALRALR